MCEIAIVAPHQHTSGQMASYSMELYSSMGSSLGLLFITESSDGETFVYEQFHSVDPEYDDVHEFIQAHREDAVRLVIHGRLATHGAVTEENSHPLNIECDECDVSCVIHNGVIRNYHYRQRELEKDGHTFSTGVDSEMIAHEYGTVPDSFEDFDVEFPHQPAYILCNEDTVYIYVGSGYRMSERGTFARNYRTFTPDTEQSYQEVILTPSNAE